MVPKRTWKQALNNNGLSYPYPLHVNTWTDSTSRWLRMPRNSFVIITHFSGPQPRSELPGCCPTLDLVRNSWDPLLRALCFLAVVIFVAYIHLFRWMECRRGECEKHPIFQRVFHTVRNLQSFGGRSQQNPGLRRKIIQPCTHHSVHLKINKVPNTKYWQEFIR